jgi:hypothetical protein
MRILILACTICLSPYRPAAAQAITPCASPTINDQAPLTGVKELASGTISGDSLWRAMVGIPKMDSTLVAFVSDSLTCTAAANAWAPLVGPAAPVEPVWVLAIGPTRYLVFDVRRPTKGYLVGAIFDAGFVWVTDILL